MYSWTTISHARADCTMLGDISSDIISRKRWLI
ncbi:hypothetical protein DAI22_06g222003 [Oryza sativa Japonica Group]|nr:hypothetical protein DAI22_06g222003 [Oryza sativa Japonica Group]